MNIHPCYRRARPAAQTFTQFEFNRVDLSFAHLPPYAQPDSTGALPDLRGPANALFDARAAAAVCSAIGDPASVKIFPRAGLSFDPEALLELKQYPGAAPDVHICAAKILAAMAYQDYFPDAPRGAEIRSMVSQALMQAGPGWCGSLGPDVNSLGEANFEGNYEFAEMFILPLVYAYFDELSPEARERAVTLLLARGRIHRANLDDSFTGGICPNDWSRAGFVRLVGNVADIPETENHVLMTGAARYLTNQLMYQRTGDIQYDNRRNGDPTDARPTCMDQLLGLLRNDLRNDFAEYNAKNYQEETRHALLNLCSYAYDAEVRLGARMVLDHISAHIAVSSNDLRRMVPFRRRNEGLNVNPVPGNPGFLDVSLLDAHGADPMPAQFALLAGQTRAWQFANFRSWPGEGPARPWNWAITPNFNTEMTLGAVTDYRLPPSIHDLFVNDLHRRFYQRLRRHEMLDEPGQQRNCANMEIYATSPSYLITAGGQPATWVIPGRDGHGYQAQNLGVAVPTSFMPTGQSARLVPRGDGSGTTSDAAELIQLMHFSDQPPGDHNHGGTINYGVAPDFACGTSYRLPDWTGVPADADGVYLVDRRSTGAELAGFYLAFIKTGSFIAMEAFDTWLHPEVSFEQFQQHVRRDNPHVDFVSGQETSYVTYFGNRIHFVVWTQAEFDNHIFGSRIVRIDYAAGDPRDTLVDAGNDDDPAQFLSGNIMRSIADGATEIHNPFLGTTLTLDWRDPAHLVRRAEDGEVEQAGCNSAGQPFEVWVDFTWGGPSEGDFYRPFKTVAAGVDAVADGGVVRVMQGPSADRAPLTHPGKACRIIAPYGLVAIGVF